ncbi:MAG TPA: hypothetical protein VFI41_12585 [Gemmatimonadales bacterium]|nr:hypothetical protein [Gemmatimonadales bacterium]
MSVRAEVRTLPQPEPPKEVILTMPYAVAQSLRALTGFFEHQLVGLEDVVPVYEALRKAGVQADPAKTTAAQNFSRLR